MTLQLARLWDRDYITYHAVMADVDGKYATLAHPVDSTVGQALYAPVPNGAIHLVVGDRGYPHVFDRWEIRKDVCSCGGHGERTIIAAFIDAGNRFAFLDWPTP